MRTVPRPKRSRERVATPAELEEDRRRCLAAKTKPPAPAQEGNLAACLVMLARWRQCCACQALLLFVNAQARVDGEFICGGCEAFLARMQQRIQFFAVAASLAVLVLS